MTPKIKIYQEDRPWGLFRQFTHNEQTTVKLITVRPNEALSLQSHTMRSEFWHILSGAGIVEIGDMKRETSAGEEYEIPVGAKHRISAGAEGLEFLEIAFGDFDESDITHYEDKYGRI